MKMKKAGPSGPSHSLIQTLEQMLDSAAKGHEREAQTLVYDAWEANDHEEKIDLLTQAIQLDPANLDAWLGLIDYMKIDDDEQIAFLRRLAAVGEKNLGKKLFKEGKGYFWGLLETRPYMRARGKLAHCLMNTGRLEESVAEHEALLELNPNDNQGLRYGLMALYLALARLDDAQRLFEQFDERQFSSVWAWGYVLERHLAGDLEGARKALSQALEQNPYMQAYALGKCRLPKHEPGMYSPGSREEAILAWAILRHAWARHPKAKAWLRAQCKN